MEYDCHLLQQRICTLETWLLQNYLELNASKCKYMTLSETLYFNFILNNGTSLLLYADDILLYRLSYDYFNKVFVHWTPGYCKITWS